jgi:hypothetical protein
MPSVSKAQHAFMAMSRTAAGRRRLMAHGKKPAPASVASEFLNADKGKKVKSLPQHKPK